MQLHFVMNPCGRVGDSLHEDILTSGGVVTKLEVLYVGIEVSWKKKKKSLFYYLIKNNITAMCYFWHRALAQSSSGLASVEYRNKGKNIFFLLTVPGFMQV